MDDPRFGTGLLDVSDAARFLGIPRSTLRRWAYGYDRGAPLLHVADVAGAREAQVTFIAMAEAHVLDPRYRGVRPGARLRDGIMPGEGLHGALDLRGLGDEVGDGHAVVV